MTETEIKARYNKEHRGELIVWLGAHGYAPADTEILEDTYYNHPSRDFFRTDEALRIRRISRDGVCRAVITYKSANRSDVGQRRDELECGVENGETTAQILTSLGFFPVVTVRKERTEFKKGGITFCLDSVDGLGEFFEVEVLGTEDESVPLSVFQEIAFASPSIEKKTYFALLLEQQEKE